MYGVLLLQYPCVVRLRRVTQPYQFIFLQSVALDSALHNLFSMGYLNIFVYTAY